MKTYIGTKIINATAMNRADYNTFRGWTLPTDENGADEGYLVEYLDGGKPNTVHYAGYVSWSPREAFDKAYREISDLSAGPVLAAQSAWAAYAVAVGGKTFDGKPLPTWEQLGLPQRRGWVAAAITVMSAVI